MPITSIRLTPARRLFSTRKTLRQFGLTLSPSSPLTISLFPPTKSSAPSSKLPPSRSPLPPLLVPTSSTPARNLSLLRRLALSAPGPFFAPGPAGQINAALFAAACLAPTHPKIRRALRLFRARQTQAVPLHP